MWRILIGGFGSTSRGIERMIGWMEGSGFRVRALVFQALGYGLQAPGLLGLRLETIDFQASRLPGFQAQGLWL